MALARPIRFRRRWITATFPASLVHWESIPVLESERVNGSGLRDGFVDWLHAPLFGASRSVLGPCEHAGIGCG